MIQHQTYVVSLRLAYKLQDRKRGVCTLAQGRTKAPPYEDAIYPHSGTTVVGPTQLNPRDLGDGVGPVGRLQRTAQERLLLHGLRTRSIVLGPLAGEEVAHRPRIGDHVPAPSPEDPDARRHRPWCRAPCRPDYSRGDRPDSRSTSPGDRARPPEGPPRSSLRPAPRNRPGVSSRAGPWLPSRAALPGCPNGAGPGSRA
jgi:hypothetical protein